MYRDALGFEVRGDVGSGGMMAKGTYATVILATADLEGTFGRVQASGAEVVQEPTDQPYGVRECAFRDPAGNHVRMNEQR